MTATPAEVFAKSSHDKFRNTIAPLPEGATARAYNLAASALASHDEFPTIDQVDDALKALDPATFAIAADESKEMNLRLRGMSTFRRWARDYRGVNVKTVSDAQDVSGEYLLHKLREYFMTSFVAASVARSR